MVGFAKGEPFKVIASLELLAITVAIIVFSPDATWTETAGRLVLTAFTDNQANSYVLDKYVHCLPSICCPDGIGSALAENTVGFGSSVDPPGSEY